MGTSANVHCWANDGERPISLCSYHGSCDPAAYLTAEDCNSPAMGRPGLGMCPLPRFQGGFHNLPDIHQP